LKRAELTPLQALPGLKPVGNAWSKRAFEGWLEDTPKVTHTASPTGRAMKAKMPSDPSVAARLLCSAFRPLPEAYPLPHFRAVEP
jgi:hypothetical protein